MLQADIESVAFTVASTFSQCCITKKGHSWCRRWNLPKPNKEPEFQRK